MSTVLGFLRRLYFHRKLRVLKTDWGNFPEFGSQKKPRTSLLG